MKHIGMLAGGSAVLVCALALSACSSMSEGDKRELLGTSGASAEHSGHSHGSGTGGAESSSGAPDTGITGIPQEPNGHLYSADETVGGCAWYKDVAGTTACVPNPLPSSVAGKKACKYLQTQGYGPLVVVSDDPLGLDDNKDGTGCYGGDWGTPAAPPDASGSGIVVPE